MRKADGFLAQVALPGLFEVFVLQVPEGTQFQFYPYPETSKGFDAFLARRFAHLGEPSECTFDPKYNRYEVHIRGLHFKDAEEALRALTAR